MTDRAVKTTDSRAALRRHYLKKLLLSREIEQEIATLSSTDGLSGLGPPFSRAHDTSDGLPILRFVFQRFVTTFPFLRSTDQHTFWSDKVQAFAVAFFGRRISSSEDRAETSKREKLANRIRSMLVLLFNAGVKAGDESVAALPPTNIVSKPPLLRRATTAVNISVATIAVRRVVKTHKLRNRKHHSEFVIETSGLQSEPVVVSRRYGAFRRLHNALRKEFRGRPLPRLPAKDKKPSTSYLPSFNPFASAQASEDDSGESAEEDDTYGDAVRLPRERQRLTLRVYLRALLKDPAVAQSDLLKDFLTDSPTRLDAVDRSDVHHREQADAIRRQEQETFQRYLQQSAQELEGHLDVFKKELVQEGGVARLFAVFRDCAKVEDMPPDYQRVASWARIELAAGLYRLFVSDDNASEFFGQAKQIHGLFPYTIMKNIIRFTNPMLMMRAIIDLFLANPFGRASLFQRMFSTTLYDDIKELDQLIAASRAQIKDEVLCNRLKDFVGIDENEQAFIRSQAEEDELDPVIAIVRADLASLGPPLSSSQVAKVFMAHVAWTSALDGVPGYDLAEARQYGHYCQLLKLYTRKRDKEQLTSLLFEGVTANLLKDIVSIFYEPLVRVYKAANVHNSVSDFASFADDSLATVKAAEESGLNSNATLLVQSFVDLIKRHENSFLRFIHDAYQHDDGLFEDLMNWIELFLAFLRSGDSRQIDLDAVVSSLPESTNELWTEVDEYIEYNIALKAWRRTRMETRLAAKNGTVNGADGGDVPTSLTGTDFGLDQDDLDDAFYEEASDDEHEALEDEVDELDPLDAELKRRRRAAKATVDGHDPEPPPVAHAYKLLPAFRAALAKVLVA